MENQINIQKCCDLIQESNSLITASKNSILILGKTGSGKSTLSNFLCNIPLEAIADANDDIIIVTKPLFQGFVFPIGQGELSETKIPNFLTVEDVKVWDCPGFNDTQVVQDIANSFYLQRVCEVSIALKIVLVIRAYLFDAKVTDFEEVLEHLLRMFDNLEQLKESLTLVVTGSSPNKTKEYYKKKIESKFANLQAQ